MRSSVCSAFVFLIEIGLGGLVGNPAAGGAPSAWLT